MGKRRKGNRINATGRNSTSRFVRLDFSILNSNAYRSLAPNARSLLVEVLMLYNSKNNGSLYLSVRDAAHRMGVADLTAASRAFDDLMEMGFIELTQDAYFKVKASEASRARCWRIAWEGGPGRKAPSLDYQTREPAPHTTGRKRMERGQRALKAYRQAKSSGRLPILDSDTIIVSGPEMLVAPVLDSETLNAVIGSFPPSSNVPDSATHIAIPWGTGARCGFSDWWQPDWTHLRASLLVAVLLAHFWSTSSVQRKVAA